MEKSLKRNITLARFVFLGLIMLLTVQLFRVQVIEHNRWEAKSATRNEFTKTYSPARGKVFFSDGSPLALSELAYDIYAKPREFESNRAKNAKVSKSQFAEDFAELAGIQKEQLQKTLTETKSLYIRIAKKVDPKVIEELSKKYPQTLNIWDSQERSKRVYPNNELAAKIIGFVNENDDGVDVGSYGVEQYFDGVLRGTQGIFEGQKDSKNNVIASENFENVNSRNGIDLTLTIDRNIQSMLEQKLVYYNDLYKSREATAVILEPGTGRIIAIANVPTYDPNKFEQGEKVDCKLNIYVLNSDCPSTVTGVTNGQKRSMDKKERELLEENFRAQNLPIPDVPKVPDVRIQKYSEFVQGGFREEKLPAPEVYRNSAQSFLYEPGSIVKVLTLAIAYQFNTIPRDPNYLLGSHNGCEKVLDTTLCTANKTPRSNLTVEKMLQYSDNVGALRIAKTINPNLFRDSLKKFGLGKATGVELAGEGVFNMKDTDWTFVDEATASYGQGSVAYTPIQVTNAWNILASNGRSFKPTILKEINDNGEVKKFNPVQGEQIIDADAAKAALRVNATATRDSIPQAKNFYKRYPHTGKTGTANIPKSGGLGYLDDLVNTSYLGSAPLENPRFTMLVWFREPRMSYDGGQKPSGGNTAQIAWVDIAEELMIKMKVPPVNQ